MTTPIMNALDIAQQPPYMLGWQELDRFQRDITAIYEQKPKEDREALLTDDCLSLILRHKWAAGNPLFERNEKIQGCIEDVARLLLHVADSLNTRLPDSIIEQCRNSTEESASRFYEIIAEAYITPAWKAQKEADSDTQGEGMGSNAATNPQTPPAAKKAPKLAIHTQKPVGRPTKGFAETIASAYKDKADIIQEHTKNALESMTDPKAVIALFIVYFKNSILKQCPTYWQTMRLLDIEADDNTDKEKLCPFGMHQKYDRQRKIYFNESDSYLSLNETDRKQDNDISSFIQGAEVTLKALLDELKPPKMKARKGA